MSLVECIFFKETVYWLAIASKIFWNGLQKYPEDQGLLAKAKLGSNRYKGQLSKRSDSLLHNPLFFCSPCPVFLSFFAGNG